MVHIKNKPELSTLFRSDELKKFFSKLLEELEDPHVLKSFLKNGCEHLYDQQIKQLSKSFIPISYENQGIAETGEAFHEIERCIDGVRFKLGDVVTDLLAPNKPPLVIGRMYEDDRGLHIRLDYALENKLTWRDLSTIDQIKDVVAN
jgi:hypothetical protein